MVRGSKHMTRLIDFPLLPITTQRYPHHHQLFPFKAGLFIKERSGDCNIEGALFAKQAAQIGMCQNHVQSTVKELMSQHMCELYSFACPKLLGLHLPCL